MKNDFPEKNTIKIELVSCDRQIEEILQLQQRNLPAALSKQEMKDQGFVTVQHVPEVLKEMNRCDPSVIATHIKKIVGYALVMPVAFRKSVPVLEPMFSLIEEISYENLPLSSYNYFIMGQVCIEKSYRGKGLFHQLYAGLQSNLSSKYDLMITEVASCNTRSLNAHLHTGLKVIYQYCDPWEVEWKLLVWDWRGSSKKPGAGIKRRCFWHNV